MKKYLIYLITMFACSPFFAQDILTTNNTRVKMENTDVFNVTTSRLEHGTSFNMHSEIDQELLDVDFNCNEEFWSINEAREIQEWSLVNGVISGGDIVLTGGGNGVAVCGDINSPTFYCTDYPNLVITYYDTQNGWISIPTTELVANNGGYGDDQYYMGAVYDPDLGFHVGRILYYFNGTTLQTVNVLESDIYNVADIAVDGFGQAWIFRGDEVLSVKSLEVYNSTGFVESFDIEFNSFGAYGSFFLHDTLYIGKHGSIIPIIINSENAELGTPMDFPNSQPKYLDLASCQDSNPLSVIDFEIYKNEFVLVPNPTYDVVNLPDYIEVISVEVINLNGQLLRTITKGSSINLAGLPNGMYILKIFTENGTVNKKIIKE